MVRERKGFAAHENLPIWSQAALGDGLEHKVGVGLDLNPAALFGEGDQALTLDLRDLGVASVQVVHGGLAIGQGHL